MRQKGLTLTTIDISNAFNEANHDLILNELKLLNVSPDYLNYLVKFLMAR